MKQQGVELLLCRPRPVMGEAPMGYLMRVARVNGLDSVHRLFAAASVSGLSAFKEFCLWLGLDDAERDRLFGVLPSRWAFGAPPLGLNVADFNQTTVRWCPLCFGHEQIIRGRWNLKLACVCTEHRVWLVGRCHRCERSWKWSDGLSERCTCGALYADAPAEGAADGIADLTAALVSDGASLKVGAQLHEMPVPMRHRLVRYLGQFGGRRAVSRPGQLAGLDQLEVAKEIVVGAQRLFDDWPVGFHEVLAGLNQADAGMPSLKRSFGALYGVLYEDFEGPYFQFLRDEFESYLHEHWWGLVCNRNRRLQRKAIDSHPRVTIAQAAKASGVGEAVLRHLVQGELIEAFTAPMASGRMLSTLHVDEAGRVRDLVSGSRTLSEVSASSSLPEGRLRDLIHAGVLEPVVARGQSGSAAWLLGALDIDRLHVAPIRGPTNDEVSVLHVLKHWRVSRSQGVELIRSVMSGVIGTCGRDHAKVPIGLARLERLATRHWLAALREREGVGLTVDQAARALGLKQQVTYDLVRRGLLCSVVDATGVSRVSRGNVTDFRSEYVALADLARETGGSARSLLARGRVRPVTGPTVDGTRQYFCRRSDLDVACRRGGSVNGS